MFNTLKNNDKPNLCGIHFLHMVGFLECKKNTVINDIFYLPFSVYGSAIAGTYSACPSLFLKI